MSATSGGQYPALNLPRQPGAGLPHLLAPECTQALQVTVEAKFMPPVGHRAGVRLWALAGFLVD